MLDNFISKPQTLKLSEIKRKYFSLMPSEHRTVLVSNQNCQPLAEFCEFENVGEQINVSDYLSFETGKYLGTISCMDNLIYNVKNGERISPFIYNGSTRKLFKGSFIISRNASLGKIAYLSEECEAILNGGLSYFKFKDTYNFYVPAFFITNYGADYLACITSGGGTQQNAKRGVLLSVPIPLPTIKNNRFPNKIIQYVSALVQNLLDKEEEIIRKNKFIDDNIELELISNQFKGKYEHNYPKISDIKKEYRADTILYTDKYKRLEFLVTNYKNGFYYIPETAIRPGKTPDDYYYTNYKADNTFEWVTPKNLSQRRLTFKTYLHTKQKSVTKKNSLIFSGIRYVGNCWFVEDDKSPIFCNQNTLVINHSEKSEEQIFIMCFFSSQIGKKLQLMQRVFGIVPILYSKDFAKIPMPNFPTEIQEKIASQYYNKVSIGSDLTLDNYLDNEKARNSKLGLFQLNEEILELNKKIAFVVDKIIKEEKIDITF